MVFLFTFLLCGVMAQAEKVAESGKAKYPEQKLSAKGIDKLQITGVKGHVKLVGRPKSKGWRLKVRHSKNRSSKDWSLSVDRQGSTLVFEVFSVAYGAQWRSHVRQEMWPEFDVELVGPAKPVTVAWREGDLDFINWKAPVEVSQIKGRVSVKNGSGDYVLALGESELEVSGLSGNLKIKGDRGPVKVVRLKGDLQLNWLSGEIHLDEVVGDGKIESVEGRLHLQDCKGDWSINLARGEARVEKCSGKLKAEGESTGWSVTHSSLSEAEIKSLSGPVQWNWAKGGAKVFLTSDQGEIKGKNISSILDGEGRRVSEFTLGARPYAQLFIRTKSGAIQFQQ